MVLGEGSVREQPEIITFMHPKWPADSFGAKLT